MALLYLKHILFDMLPSAELKARGRQLSISNHLEMIHDILWAINALILDSRLQVCFMEILRENLIEKAEVESLSENLIDKEEEEEFSEYLIDKEEEEEFSEYLIAAEEVEELIKDLKMESSSEGLIENPEVESMTESLMEKVDEKVRKILIEKREARRWLSKNSVEKAMMVGLFSKNLVEKVEVKEWVKEVDLAIVDVEELLGRILLWKPTGMTEANNHCFLQPTLDDIKHVFFRYFILIELKEISHRLNYLRRRGSALGLRNEMLDCMHPLQEDYANILRDEMVGREKEKIDIIDILKQKQQRPINDDGNDYTTSFIVIQKDNIDDYSIVEETILTHMIYYDHWVYENFKYRIWVDASNIWDIDSTRILEEIYRSIKGKEYLIQKEENANWLTIMKDLLGTDRYLLILNDYNYSSHYEDRWEKLKGCLLQLGGQGSATIITMSQGIKFHETQRDVQIYSLRYISKGVWKRLLTKQIAAIQPTVQLHEAHTLLLFDSWHMGFRSLEHARIVGAILRFCKMKGWSAAAAAAAATSDPLPQLSLFIMERFMISTSLSVDVRYFGVLYTQLSMYHLLVFEDMRFYHLQLRLDYLKDMLHMCEAEGFQYSSITRYLPISSELLDRISYLNDNINELRQWSFCLRVGEEEDAGIRIPPQCLYLCLRFLGTHAASRSLFYRMRSLSSGINKRLRAFFILDERQKEDPGGTDSSASIVQEDQLVHETMKDIFGKLKCLRILYIRGTRIREMSKMLGKLHSLRYIKLFEMEIRTLPKSLLNLCNLKILNIDHCEQLQKLPKRIDKLVNLSVLKLRYCTKLQKLPKSIRRLIGLEVFDVEGCHWLIDLPEALEKMKNLRVLAMAECASLTKIPINIRHMTCLEALSGLVASYDDDGTGSRCVIDELQELTSLRMLELRNLERVSKKEEDIRRINLQDKGRLERLALHWECWNIDEGESDAATVPWQVIEALKPDSEHLKSLDIISYQGQHFPSWMKQDRAPTTCVINYLTEIRLINLRKCEKLPPLGHLPILETIEISGMDLISVVDNEGTFPSLSFLILSEMPELEQWKFVRRLHLKGLTLIRCPKFKGFHPPRQITVYKLSIWLNDGTFWTSNSSFWNSFEYFERLEIVGCHDLRIFPLQKKFDPRIFRLTIISCNNLEVLPEQFKENIDIEVEGCPKLCGF